MKTKNLVSLLAVALLFLASVSLTSCGGEEDEPQPIKPDIENPTKPNPSDSDPVVKTDLEKVKEAITGSVWTLKHAKISTATEVFEYEGDCDFRVFGANTALATATTDFKYTFVTNSTLSYEEQCGEQTESNISYSIKQTNDVFTLTYVHGSADVDFELVTPVEELNGDEVKVRRTTRLIGGATEALLTFERSK